MTTTHLGYGPFQLRDLIAGEEFVLSDASFCKVERPLHRVGERIRVWLDHETLNGRPAFLHRTARVFAVSRLQTRCIARRLAQRLRRETEKGRTP